MWPLGLFLLEKVAPSVKNALLLSGARHREHACALYFISSMGQYLMPKEKNKEWGKGSRVFPVITCCGSAAFFRQKHWSFCRCSRDLVRSGFKIKIIWFCVSIVVRKLFCSALEWPYSNFSKTASLRCVAGSLWVVLFVTLPFCMCVTKCTTILFRKCHAVII